MVERDRRRGPRRQVLGVAGLTAVASGTTALVIGMGSSQFVTPDLMATPYADGASGGPLVVDAPPAGTGSTGHRTDRGTTGNGTGNGTPQRAIGVAPVVRTPAGPPAPVPAPAPAPGGGTIGPIRIPVLPFPGLGDGTGNGTGTGDGSGPVHPFPTTQPGIRIPGVGVPGVGVPGVGLPGTGLGGRPGTPAPGGDACRVDDGGTQLPEDVVRRLEEWLCGLTGRPVVVVAKPLKLLHPVVPATRVTAPRARTTVVHSPKHAALVRAPRAEARRAARQAQVRRAAAHHAEVRQAWARSAEREARHQAAQRRDAQRREHAQAGRHGHGGDRRHGWDVPGAGVTVDLGLVSLRYEGRHRFGAR
ncbi:MAG TPA: hypothetical protein VGD72_12490 [Mycobacteriales bacterium]|jgi:hypothetical protein